MKAWFMVYYKLFSRDVWVSIRKYYYCFVSINILGKIFYVETCRNCWGYVRVICDTLGYGGVFWYCFVLVGLSIMGMVRMLEYA